MGAEWEWANEAISLLCHCYLFICYIHLPKKKNNGKQPNQTESKHVPTENATTLN
jgi:hypothetical protein